ncbi:MAG: peptidase MA family metallohydrolase [Propionibacteriaceae bacterium]
MSATIHRSPVGQRLVLAALTLIVVACAACSGPSATAPTAVESRSTAPATSRLNLVRATVDALAEAARTGDRPGFYRLLTDRDASFHDRARLLYDNLSTLPLTTLRMRVEPTQFGLSETRRKLLGPDAWVQRVLVTWRLAGDGEEVQHWIWLTFLEAAGEVKIAGTIDEPAGRPTEQKPSWWLGPLTATQRGGVTVLAGSGQSLDRWSTLAAAAVRNVREFLPNGLGASWNRQVVIEVPATQRDFESVLGKSDGEYASIAAVTQRAGVGGDAIRMVVNPRAARLGSGALQAVLEHEMVHVATRSPNSVAPMWVEEGLAEWVSMRAHPGQRSSGTDELLIGVRSDGAPRAFPADRRFEAGAGNLQLAYAEAWLACRFIADRYSETKLGQFYAALVSGKSLDEASRSTLELSESDLTAEWRAYLDRLARY